MRSQVAGTRAAVQGVLQSAQVFAIVILRVTKLHVRLNEQQSGCISACGSQVWRETFVGRAVGLAYHL